MMIASENQLLAIDETCLSDLSEENESTISGGTFGLFGGGGLLGGLLGGIFGLLFGQPSYGYGQPSNASTGTTVIVNNYITNTNTNSSGSSSGSGSSSK